MNPADQRAAHGGRCARLRARYLGRRTGRHVGKVRVGPGSFRLILADLGRRSIGFGGESAETEAAEVSAEFEGLEDVAPDSGGEEFGDDGGADGG